MHTIGAVRSSGLAYRVRSVKDLSPEDFHLRRSLKLKCEGISRDNGTLRCVHQPWLQRTFGMLVPRSLRKRLTTMMPTEDSLSVEIYGVDIPDDCASKIESVVRNRRFQARLISLSKSDPQALVCTLHYWGLPIERNGIMILRRSLGEEIVEAGLGIVGSGDVGAYSNSSVGLLRELDGVLRRSLASEERARILRRGRWKRRDDSGESARSGGALGAGVFSRVLQAFRRYRDVDRWGGG